MKAQDGISEFNDDVRNKMGLFEKLFKKNADEKQRAHTPPQESSPQMIRVFDKFGRPMDIPREEWRTKVLAGHLQQHWNKPDALYAAIVQSLQDGFFEDVLPAADHLAQTDHNKLRGTIIKIVTLLQLKRYAEALATGEKAEMELGPDGVLLTNIAKAQAGLGQQEIAEKTLWRALEKDPNQDNALGWYGVIERERGGLAAEQAAFERVAAIEGSWRAQLWLARYALEAKRFTKALSLYKAIFKQLNPIPPDAFMQISGDLGKNGLIQEIIELCAPIFDVNVHGLAGGNNLLKAYTELKQPQSARELLKQLYALQRPDWQEHLQFWDGEIDKLDHPPAVLDQTEKLQLVLIPYDDRPIWAPLDSPITALIPTRQADSPKIFFMCGTSSTQPEVKSATVGKTEVRGRFTRGLAAWLVEQTLLQTNLHASLIVPWMQSGGFVLSGEPWDVDFLAKINPAPDWIVFSHLAANKNPWNLEITLQNFATREIAYQANHSISPEGDGKELLQIWQGLAQAIQQRGIAHTHHAPEWYAPVQLDTLPYYIGTSEQALAVSCSGVDAPNNFLYSERSINDAMLDLGARNPGSPLPILLLLATLLRQQDRVPEIVAEYKKRARNLVEDANISSNIKKLASEVLAQLEAKDSA